MVLVLVTAGSAIAGFVVLSRGIDQVLDDNVRSIEASMTMLESLERQDSATLSALLGAGGAAADLADADQVFREALAAARGNITEDAEREVLVRLGASHEELVTARDRLVASAPDEPLRGYEQEVLPRFHEVKAGVRDLLDVNHAAMQRADVDARASARRSGAWIGLVVTIAVVSLVLLSRALQSRVLERLATVREVSQALASGDTKRRVMLTGDDELTEIACRLNDVLDRREESQGRWRGRLAVEKRLALALFDRLDPGGTVFALDGTVLIGDEDPAGDRSDLRAKIADWIAENGSASAENLGEKRDEEVEIEGTTVRLELLQVGPSRPVAWWWRAG